MSVAQETRITALITRRWFFADGVQQPAMLGSFDEAAERVARNPEIWDLNAVSPHQFGQEAEVGSRVWTVSQDVADGVTLMVELGADEESALAIDGRLLGAHECDGGLEAFGSDHADAVVEVRGAGHGAVVRLAVGRIELRQVRSAAEHVAGEDVVDGVVGQHLGEVAAVVSGDEPAVWSSPDVDDGVDLVNVQELKEDLCRVVGVADGQAFLNQSQGEMRRGVG